MLSEYETRKNKVEELQKAGIQVYPAGSKRTHFTSDIHERFNELQGKTLWLVGRIMSLRRLGKIIFAFLEDARGKVQIIVREETLGKDSYAMFQNIFDRGDFINVSGILEKSKTQEKSLHVQTYTLLSKALRPLPEKWHGLKDEEERQRRRYLDLLMNPEVRKRFVLRSLLIRAFRDFLYREGFLEVETPVLENIPGGADAEPFITHHNTLDIDLYLRIAIELPLKRLIVGGYEKVFELGRVFRNEGMSTQHLQEFTSLEFYCAYQEYRGLMEFVERLYASVVVEVFPDQAKRFQAPWPRIPYVEIVKQKTGVDILALKNVQELQGKIDIDSGMSLPRAIDRLYKKYVRPDLKGPVFLIDFPLIFSPLAKKKEDDPRLTERFVVVIDGVEVGNAFSELNDPIDQKQRFLEQMKMREAGDKEAQMMDADYVEAMEYGMPPIAGFGVGIDRFFMILSRCDSVRETVLFPIMKPKI